MSVRNRLELLEAVIRRLAGTEGNRVVRWSGDGDAIVDIGTSCRLVTTWTGNGPVIEYQPHPRAPHSDSYTAAGIQAFNNAAAQVVRDLVGFV